MFHLPVSLSLSLYLSHLPSLLSLRASLTSPDWKSQNDDGHTESPLVDSTPPVLKIIFKKGYLFEFIEFRLLV